MVILAMRADGRIFRCLGGWCNCPRQASHRIFCHGKTCKASNVESSILTLVTRARENRKGKPIPPLNATTPAAAPATCSMEQRSLEEQQAALNLAKLSGDKRDNGIATLIDAMIVSFPVVCSSRHRC